jgi:hypothetical protein
MSDPDRTIQYKAPYRALDGRGLDDDGNPVLVTDDSESPQGDQFSPADYKMFFRMVTIGADTVERVGERALLLSYLALPRKERATLEEIGIMLGGISKQAVEKKLTKFRALLPEIIKECYEVG